jgi:indolepyruvate ferredoxin oxidoreductase
MDDRSATRPTALDDKLTLERGRVLLTGIQALVRLPLDQRRRDARAGLSTAGFISGYRGSPLGGYDQQLVKARALLAQHQIRFQPGINEDLAATAVWGSQQVGLFPDAKVAGVFGLWYGKAPGVDRSGDAFKHANLTGTARHGGVLAVAGDDPQAKSSTFPCQSELAFVDAEMPVLTPADVQEVLELGLHGIALSRHSGLWVGMIALADLMDGTATVAVDPDRPGIVIPAGPDDGRHIDRAAIRLAERTSAEARLRLAKLPAALDYIRANRLNRIVVDSPAPRIALIASGKAWHALRQSLAMLGIDDADAARLGLRLAKIAAPWPLESASLRSIAEGLERVLVIEPKRALIEPQLKDQLYHLPTERRPQVLGKQDAAGAPLLPTIGDLAPDELAPVIAGLIPPAERTPAMRAALERLAARAAPPAGPEVIRTPYFCAGCPHNSSTQVPEGSRAMAGIGCHIMAQWMGRAEDSYAQMGGEGVPWLGQAPFVTTAHMLVNLGDGTYHHSGLLAIRAAVAAGARMTYKILYNDAVAMTGGQAVDGPQTVAQITRQLAAEGVRRIVVVSEQPAELRAAGGLAPGVELHGRAALAQVQAELRDFPGLSVLIYDQTCAAEKRRRRKRGKLAEAPMRLFINDRVCEACGDCSRASNCVAVEPIETPFGTKRAISQAACNQDLACGDGFCPSFVEVRGGRLRRPERAPAAFIEAAAGLRAPLAPVADRAHSIVVAGIGGLGVTTVSAILAMAAHLAGREVAALDMTGLAQKGGAVVAHLRLAPAGRRLDGGRIATGQADALLAGDLVVASGRDTLRLLDPERTRTVANSGVLPTAEFVRAGRQSFQPQSLARRLAAASADYLARDASALAVRHLGDAVFANLILAGMAFQQGLLPLPLAALEAAIRLNGIAVEANLAAFALGRLSVAAPDSPLLAIAPAPAAPAGLDERIAFLAAELTAYQDRAYAARYLAQVEAVRAKAAELGAAGEALVRAVADNLFKLMAYKDEYEVARLYADPAFRAKLAQQFEGEPRLAVRLAPPLLARRDPRTGRPRKRTFGPWIFPLFRLLARLKGLRGTAFDPFGYTAERRAERRLIAAYEASLRQILPGLSAARLPIALELARLPERIRGFGPIKIAAIAAAEEARAALLAQLEAAGDTPDPAHLVAAE